MLKDPEARDGLAAKVKKELMGSQIWFVVVTWAMVASMASMVASMASIVLMAPRSMMEIASSVGNWSCEQIGTVKMRSRQERKSCQENGG